MKKLLAGCLIALVLVAVASGVATVYLWRAARPMVESVSQMADGVKQLPQLLELRDGISNREPFGRPANGELTPAQVERFLRVQTQVRRTLGERADAFKEKYKALATTRPDGTEVTPSLPQLLAGMSDMSNVYMEARRAQVAALNAERFSWEEFNWVRLRVYQAAGTEATGYDAREMEQMLKQLASGAMVPAPELELPDAPAKNRELVKPHAAQLMEWLAMASFGL